MNKNSPNNTYYSNPIKAQAIPDLNKMNFLEALIYDKKALLNLIFLIVYTILIIILYVKNPSEFITNHTNISIALTAIVTLYIYYINVNTDEKAINFKFIIFKYTILLLCFITTVLFLYIYNPGGYIVDVYKLPIIFILCSAFILLTAYLCLYVALAGSTSSTASQIKTDQSAFIKILTYFFIGSFGTIVTILFVQYILGLIAGASSASGIVKAMVNICIVLIVAYLLYRLITYTDFYKESPLVQLILESIFYIPCLFVASTDKIVQAVSSGKGTKKTELFNTKPSDYILLAVAVTLNAVYFIYPYVAAHFAKQGGLLLVNMPVFTDSEYNLGSYVDLNGADSFDYTFAISFCLYIDAASPSVRGNSASYSSLLNYGNKPNVLYNVLENSLMVTMANPYSSSEEAAERKMVLDEYGNVIIYTMNDLLLQKWNNFIINYNGGTLDIFYNGELVKSFPQIVPYMNYDSLTIGENNGVKGGICNVNYFKNPVNMSQIYHLYNYVKDKTPPVYTNNDETIINIMKKS